MTYSVRHNISFDDNDFVITTDIRFMEEFEITKVMLEIKGNNRLYIFEEI